MTRTERMNQGTLPGRAPQTLLATESTQSLIELGRAAEREGRHAVARRYFEAALHAIAPGVNPSLSVEVTRWIGRSYLRDGNPGAAIDCAETSGAIAEAQDDLPGLVRALRLGASALRRSGRSREALPLLLRSRTIASRIADPSLICAIELDVGDIASRAGDAKAALAHYEAGLRELMKGGRPDEGAAVLVALGRTYTDLGRFGEAEVVLEEAGAIATGAADRVAVGVARTRLALVQGLPEIAKGLCDQAFRQARQIDDRSALGELHRLYGSIYRETDQLSSAEAHLSRAGAAARELGDALLGMEAALEEAGLFGRQGRNQETLRSLIVAYRCLAEVEERQSPDPEGARSRRLQQTFLEIVRRWAESIESADQYTQGHCTRVASYACALASRAGMDEQTLFWFRLGAMLHDLGKIVVPADVLNRSGELTAAERKLVERHPDAGAALLAEIEFPWDVRPMVRHHHERWQGGGYPQGLTGEAIPLAARILCIADVYDALTSERPYRDGLTPECAIEIMTTSMASHFDPALLEQWRVICESGVAPALAKESSRARPSERSDPGVDDPTPSILVIARNFSDARLLREAAAAEEGAGAEIVHVARLTDAIQRLRSESFDAVVLGLPLQDGQEMQALARVHEQASGVPILILAGVVDEAFATRAIRMGAQEYLVRRETSGAMLLRAVRFSIERNRLRVDLHAKSLVDDLTGLYNRRGFFSMAGRQLKLADKRKERAALVFADVNGFKQINDQLGHREGDLALIDISTLMKSTFRVSDTLGRLGGDEFVALIPDTGAGGVAALIDRLEQHVAVYNAHPGRRFRLSISLGSAIYDPRTPVSIDELLRLADASMYEEKRRMVNGE